jgi:hypothetical protein
LTSKNYPIRVCNRPLCEAPQVAEPGRGKVRDQSSNGLQMADNLNHTPVGKPGLPQTSRLPSAADQEPETAIVRAVMAGPEAAGYSCGCWTTCLIQKWIYQQCGVDADRDQPVRICISIPSSMN